MQIKETCPLFFSYSPWYSVLTLSFNFLIQHTLYVPLRSAYCLFFAIIHVNLLSTERIPFVRSIQWIRCNFKQNPSENSLKIQCRIGKIIAQFLKVRSKGFFDNTISILFFKDVLRSIGFFDQINVFFPHLYNHFLPVHLLARSRAIPWTMTSTAIATEIIF